MLLSSFPAPLFPKLYCPSRQRNPIPLINLTEPLQYNNTIAHSPLISFSPLCTCTCTSHTQISHQYPFRVNSPRKRIGLSWSGHHSYYAGLFINDKQTAVIEKLSYPPSYFCYLTFPPISVECQFQFYNKHWCVNNFNIFSFLLIFFHHSRWPAQ